MTSTPQFAHCDTKKPDGFYVQFERVIVHDHTTSPLDYDAISARRMSAWRNDKWHYIGIRAMAKCMIAQNGVGTYTNLESPGLWGVESDSGEKYLNSIYRDEIAELKSMIAAMRNPVYEDAAE